MNPVGWLRGRRYTCLECPAGSEEVPLNEGNVATREPDPIVPLPAPPPGKKFVWPVPPTPPQRARRARCEVMILLGNDEVHLFLQERRRGITGRTRLSIAYVRAAASP